MKFFKSRFLIIGFTGVLVSGVSFYSLKAPGVAQTAQETTPPQEAAKPALFAIGYDAGHELAGFSGRPMVLVFGDSRTPGWNEFLLECESDQEVAEFLSTKFTGTFVDLSKEVVAKEVYGITEPGTLVLKDLHGPVLGILKPGFVCEDLTSLLKETAKSLWIEKSPLYAQLLQGPEILEDLVQREEVEEAAKGVRLLRIFEPNTKALDSAESQASALNLITK